MFNKFKIGSRTVGDNELPLIIAEIGINHNGSLDAAIAIAESAIRSGAEVIKHQTHIVDDEMINEAKKIIPGNSNKSIYEIISKCALNESDEKKLMNHVKKLKSIFISTPFSREAANRLNRFNVPAFKIGSGECNNYPLIDYISNFNKPMIISTGMNDIESIRRTVLIIERKKIPYALLHCTNVYPTPPELVRLGAINELKKNFPKAVLGLSDHTINNFTCYGAISLGASIIEKHFTDTKDRKGPDIICSMDSKELKEMLLGVKTLYSARGSYKGPVDEEKPTIAFAFVSVVAIKDILKDDTLDYSNIWIKRPGNGDFSSLDFESLIGKVAKKNIKKDEQLKKEDIF